MLKPFESFRDPITMPLRERWHRALRDPGYLGLWAGLIVVLVITAILVT